VVAGRSSRIRAKDLTAVRDFTDVRDVARGYLALAEHATSGRVYNLCSGRASTVRDVLGGLLRAAGLDWTVVDPLPVTRGGLSYQVGSPNRIRLETGWSADIPLDTSTGDLLNALMQADGHSSVSPGE
jgi:GDP-4-dehydro-6-deoxy-D-mannose reductase